MPPPEKENDSTTASSLTAEGDFLSPTTTVVVNCERC